jgi:nucleolar protein 53
MSSTLKFLADDSSGKTLFYDLWDNDSSKPQTSLLPELEDYYLKQVKKKQPKKFIPKVKITSEILAVDKPHPGSSYNPALDDHMGLLMEATKVEQEKMKKERRLQRALKLPPAKDLVTPEIKMRELKEGLGPIKSEDEDEEESTDPDAYRPAVAVISAENRKLKSVRRREKLRKEQEKQRKNEKLKRIRQSEIYRLRSIKKDLKRQEKESLDKREQKKRRKERLAKTRPAKLSATPYEAPDIDLQLSTELRGSMLGLKPEGNLLEDRYKSLQKRGVVEPRVMQNRRRKYKLKTYERRAHRDMPEGYLPR